MAAYRPLLALAVLAVSLPLAAAEVEPDYDRLRMTMLRHVQLESMLARDETGLPEIDARILEAMAEVPRHLFVPLPLRHLAYEPRPLPVWDGQNTASPFLVALMTQLARIKADHTVFETGTGAGYHAAILSRLAARVFSIEVIEPLAAETAENLKSLGYGTVSVRAGDGYYGWPEAGPFDAIIVKESVDHVPIPLLRQLKPGGRLVIPLGAPTGPQFLTVIELGADGRLRRTPVLPVLFSPLQGGERT